MLKTVSVAVAPFTHGAPTLIAVTVNVALVPPDVGSKQPLSTTT